MSSPEIEGRGRHGFKFLERRLEPKMRQSPLNNHGEDQCSGIIQDKCETGKEM